MAEIILSLRNPYYQKEVDLEVSGDQPIRECIDLVAVQQGWATREMLASTAYSVEAAPGRNLPLNLTFQQARVWNGAELVFHPAGKPSPEKPPEPVKPAEKKEGYQFIRLD